jgi:hypothetical protein
MHDNVDIEWQLDFQTVVTAIASTDHLAGKNHYLYHEPTTDRWRLMNWDLELTYGAFWDASNNGLYNDQIDITRVGMNYGITGGNRMLSRMFDVNGPTGQDYFDRAYHARLWAHYREKTNEFGVTDARAEELRALLQDEQADDIFEWGRFPPTPNPSHPDSFDYNVDELLDIGAAAGDGYLRRSMNHLRNQLSSTGFTNFPWVRITEIQYNPSGALEDEEFIELTNTESDPVDISGWYINAIDYEFPGGTTLLGGETIVVARNLAAFESRYGTLTARVFGPYTGNLSNDGERIHLYEHRPGVSGGPYPATHPITIDFVAYRDIEPWPTTADGEGPSLELLDLALDNDLPDNWTSSSSPAGTPGGLFGDEPSTTIDLEFSPEVGFAPLEVTFNAIGGFEPPIESHLTANWSFGDGDVDTGLEVTHTYTAPGIYQGSASLFDGIATSNAVFTVTVFQGPTQSFFIRGDSNVNGVVEIGDAVKTLLGMFRGVPLDCRRAADSDDNGAIDINDPMIILRHLFLGEAPPAAPFPGCGLDTTIDGLECTVGSGCSSQ